MAGQGCSIVRCLDVPCGWMSINHSPAKPWPCLQSLGWGHASQTIAANAVGYVLAWRGSCVPTSSNHAACFAFASLQVFHKHEFGNWLSLPSTAHSPFLTLILQGCQQPNRNYLGFGSTFGHTSVLKIRDLRFIQVEEKCWVFPLCAPLCWRVQQTQLYQHPCAFPWSLVKCGGQGWACTEVSCTKASGLVKVPK